MNALPVELTHFVGRAEEMAALRQLAGAVRLLTLTGAGGSGKSRLALELLPDLPAATGAEIAWVELAPLVEAGLLPGAVLRALGSTSEGGAATAERIIPVVGTRRLILVLDNCEHLVDACAELADRLLRACGGLSIIATSREALGVAGERAWLVPPLMLPPRDGALDAIARADAVTLFLDRARDVMPGFDLTLGNAGAVVDICRRLDGIPLAIELAAARVRHLTPDQIRDRLGDAFALLTTGMRNALPRHRTLRATLDWSHDLLPSDARTVLRRLSVFRDGFTLDLGEAVAGGDGIASDGVLDLIATLADRSLVVVREHDGHARYHLLEIVRQYAAHRLEEAGESEQVRRRFAQVVCEQVAALEPSFITPARRTAFSRLEPELDNIREVLAWTHEHEPAQHVRLVGMLWWFWFSTRHWVEANRWITGALALPASAAPTRDRAALLFAAGALGALRAQSDQARPLLEEAVVVAASVGDERLAAYANNYIAMTWASGRSLRAREYVQLAEQWFRPNADFYGLRLALLLGGMTEDAAGNTAEAFERMEEAVLIARSFGQDRELAVALQTYATILIGKEEMARAHAMVVESLRALRRDPSFLFIARAIDHYALTRSVEDPAGAARMIGVADAMRRHIGADRFGHDTVLMQGLITTLRAGLGERNYDEAYVAGLQVNPSDAIDNVLEQDASAGPEQSVQQELAAELGQRARSEPATGRPADVGTTVDLRVRALGPFEVVVDGEVVESWTYAKPKELLALLLLSPTGRTRAEIGAALWPDAAPAQVRNSFHVTMHHLRKALGHSEWIVLQAERYRIAPSVAVEFDVDQFRTRVREALSETDPAATEALRSAMRLYRSHFLSGEVAGAWRDDVQDGLRRLFCDAGLKLAGCLADAGDVDDAAATYEAVIAAEPLHEEAHRRLLLMLLEAGQRAQALRHYVRLGAVLQELELEPEPETLAVYERLRTA